jgi:hypothetical protein
MAEISFGDESGKGPPSRTAPERHSAFGSTPSALGSRSTMRSPIGRASSWMVRPGPLCGQAAPIRVQMAFWPSRSLIAAAGTTAGWRYVEFYRPNGLDQRCYGGNEHDHVSHHRRIGRSFFEG